MSMRALELQGSQLAGCPRFSGSVDQQARPFIKWVGGKGQLLNQIDSFLPLDLKLGKLNTFVEPFVGGGAVFFHVAQRYPLSRFILSDNNTDLILAYWTIRERVGTLITILHEMQSEYLGLSEEKRQDYYYSVREQFNNGRSSIDMRKFSDAWLERTSQFIFLNKTGFNGLFRVNSAGLYNVAFGRYDSPKICDAENLVRVSNLLKRADIFYGDFSELLPFIPENSFVYLDPPYRPLTETANFTAYSASTFTNLDQLRLASFCQNLGSLDAKIMISNSDPSNIDPEDRYFAENYPDFRIERTEANRMVNCKAERRGKISELLIMNF